MPLYRYSRWDGTQKFDLDADELLSAMADDLLADGDPWRALRRLMQQGARLPEGQRMPGLKDLLDRLRRQRQQRLDRYDLGSSLEDIKQKLEEIVETERQGIKDRTPEGPKRAQREQKLDAIPSDPAGRLRDLQRYEFVSPEAKQKFDELLASLRQQMMQPMFNSMQQALRHMTPQDLARMREMMQDLNRMLRQKADGEEPDFDAFMAKWGQNFPGVESLDQLIEQIGRQMAAMQSLMQSLSPEQRQQLDEMMRGLMLQDERLEAQMRQLAMNLAEFLPLDEMARRYPFKGDDELSMQEAMRLMREMQELDDLEREIRGVRALEDLEQFDRERVERLLGREAAEDLERLQELTRQLEDAGYLERQGDELALTARAIRKIADQALREVFAVLKRDRIGGHAIQRRGAGGDQTDETRAYEFGDPFLLDLKETVMNALERGGPGTPLRLAPGDFEVYRTELRTQAATVVMLDMSRSMLNNGYFLPAKKVALALSALIRGQFPRDALYIIGFSLYARTFTPEQLPTLSWSEWNIGTNMHAGFALSRRLLGKHKGGNKQILMVTDGEPTAHLEGERARFAWPPIPKTIRLTLAEATKLSRSGVTLNVFMLEDSPGLIGFMERLAELTGGRVFLMDDRELGSFVLRDFVRRRAS
jgi:uncharacterized protein with von Willebrand factor type A (vWA) domain